MNSPIKMTITCLVAAGTLELFVIASKMQAQTNINSQNLPTIPIGDGARHLTGLEAEKSSLWDLVVGGETQTQKKEDYQLSVYKTDVRIIEQDRQQWRNTGEDADYSILVDFDNFLEEERK